jgi:hypothetical protein
MAFRGSLLHPRRFICGRGAALLLLFIGIHNARDAVAYRVFVNTRDKDAGSRQEEISERDLP